MKAQALTTTGVAALLLAGLLGACGGQAEPDPERAASDAARNDLLDRQRAADDEVCEAALGCYGRSDDPAYECFAPTSDGGFYWRDAPPFASEPDPDLEECSREVFHAYQEEATTTMECNIAVLEALAECIADCPEVVDDCLAARTAALCMSPPELFAMYFECLGLL